MRLRSLIMLLSSAAACAAPAIAVSGCGSSSSLDPVAQAAETTQHEGGSRMALNMSFDVPGAGTTVSASGSGSYNYKAKEGAFTMTMSGLPQLSSGLKLEERIKGTTVYVGSDLFAGKLPGGARWAKLDLQRFLGKAFGLNLQQLSSGQSNPAQMLEYLKASSGGVTVVGHQRVRGVETTRYRGTLDLEKQADQAPPAFRTAEREAIAKMVQKTGTRFIPAEVWVDAQHRVRRFEMSLAVSQGGQTVTVAANEELFDYGPTPAVVIPPASETYDLTQAVLSGLGSSSAEG